MKKLILFLFLLITTYSLAQVIPIDSVRRLDANGVPILVGQHVLVKGVVTTTNELMSGTTPIKYFQVPTAGLVAFDAPFGNGAHRGDSVIVGGLVTNYNGLIELSPVDSFRVLATGITTPTPVVITCTQARNGEQWEGRLIRINGITQVKTTAGVPVTQWSVTGSGTNYRIFVGTDSCDIRIYGSSNIANSMIPAFPFDVVALMSQFTSTPPYNTGYQILPRDLNDLISQAVGPNIVTIPSESNITPTSVTISFSTLSNGDTKVKYFVSDSLYQPVIYTDSVYDANQTTNHSITLNNLKPGRIYYATITSTNVSGTSTYTPKYFATASNPASTGRIELYFNFTVDTTLAFPNNKAKGNTDFATRLIQRIDSAQYSIDMCLYSFIDLSNIRDHILSAFVRGVKIRMVYDFRNGTPQPLVQDLINAGIPISIRPSSSYIMHNKFFIFDARDTSLHSKKWLWTGSANIGNDQFYADAENVILIQDETLCHIYTREFEEMFGSHSNYPNSTLAKFGSQKLNNTPHIVNINGRRIDSYFSPSDDVLGKILNIIDLTNKSINFCIFAFTSITIENKMHSKYIYPTQMVRGVFDRGQATGPDSLIYREMKGISGNPTYNWNPPAKVFLDNYPGLLHDKYILIDADMPSSNPVVETGSYNFSTSAQTGNDENVLMIYDSLIANQYYQDFSKRLTDAGGSLGISKVSNNVPDKFELNQNYPNPFNPLTKINFSVSEPSNVKIAVYNVLGQEILYLVNTNLYSGKYEVTFDGTNLSSGVYFYTMFVDNVKINSHTMCLIK